MRILLPYRRLLNYQMKDNAQTYHFNSEIIFEGGLVSHGKLDSAQVHLRSVFTYSAEEKCCQNETFGDLVTNSLKLLNCI